MSARDSPTRYAERREARFTHILDFSPKFTEGIDKQANRPLLHSLRASYDMSSRNGGEIGGQETHRCACRTDIDKAEVRVKRVKNHAGVVRIREPVRRHLAMAERSEEEQTVTDTFGSREIDYAAE